MRVSYILVGPFFTFSRSNFIYLSKTVQIVHISVFVVSIQTVEKCTRTKLFYSSIGNSQCRVFYVHNYVVKSLRTCQCLNFSINPTSYQQAVELLRIVTSPEYDM